MEYVEVSMQTPRLLRLLAAMLLAASMMQSCDPVVQPADDLALTLHPALRKDGSKDREAKAVLLLKCDPCQVFEAPDGAEFFFGPDSEMAIRRGDIRFAMIIPSERSGRLLYMLHLELTQAGAIRLGSYADRMETALTVNKYQGEAIGLVPLSLNGDRYVAGRFASEEDAVRVVTEIGVPFRVEDPIPARRIPSA